jgi:hypothetical protein
MRLKDQVTTSNKRDQRCAVVTNKEAKEVHSKKCLKAPNALRILVKKSISDCNFGPSDQTRRL